MLKNLLYQGIVRNKTQGFPINSLLFSVVHSRTYHANTLLLSRLSSHATVFDRSIQCKIKLHCSKTIPPLRPQLSLLRSRRALSTAPPRGGGPTSPVSWTSLTFALLVGTGIVAYYRYEQEQQRTKAMSKVVSYGKPALGGPFTLVNIDGEPVTDASYSDGYMLLYFGFSYCPDICPSELVKMGKIIDRLDKIEGITKDRIVPVFISLDCKRDSLEQLKLYSKDFNPKVQFLIGCPEQVEAAARAYRVYFSDTNELEDDETDYLIDHSIVMYLVSPEGEFLEFYTQLASVQECVERITSKIEEHESKKE